MLDETGRSAALVDRSAALDDYLCSCNVASQVREPDDGSAAHDDSAAVRVQVAEVWIKCTRQASTP
jgi:hypothetical protein